MLKTTRHLSMAGTGGPMEGVPSTADAILLVIVGVALAIAAISKGVDILVQYSTRVRSWLGRAFWLVGL
jgi:hypothetical protein